MSDLIDLNIEICYYYKLGNYGLAPFSSYLRFIVLVVEFIKNKTYIVKTTVFTCMLLCFYKIKTTVVTCMLLSFYIVKTTVFT